VIVGLGGRDPQGHYFASAFAPALLICAILKLLAVLWYLGAPSAAPAPSRARGWRLAGYLTALPLLAVAGLKLAPSDVATTARAFLASAVPSTSVAVASAETTARSARIDALLETVRRLESDIRSAATAREDRLTSLFAAIQSETEGSRTHLSAIAQRLATVELALAEKFAQLPRAEPPREKPEVVSDGCAASVLARASTEVAFARDQWSIDVRNTDGIDTVADLLRQCRRIRLLVEGFSDPRGSESANRTLARRRAERVAAYLATRGIVPERIVVADTSAGDRRPRSRRVDVSVILEPQSRVGASEGPSVGR
jgi:outer membrane protein OmpA-like peptidoglycan-associated protein